MRKHASVKPPVKVKAVDVQTALRLPMPGPGIKVRIPLHLLPAYLDLYGLALMNGQVFPPVGPPPVLRVRRTGKSNDGH